MDVDVELVTNFWFTICCYFVWLPGLLIMTLATALGGCAPPSVYPLDVGEG
jgi:hypothetical protein